MLTLFASGSSFAQMNTTLTANDNQTIRTIANDVQASGWLSFSEAIEIHSGDLFSTYKSATGLGPDDKMVEVKSWQDDSGYSHKKLDAFLVL